MATRQYGRKKKGAFFGTRNKFLDYSSVRQISAGSLSGIAPNALFLSLLSRKFSRN
jgi:hypothetical protein